MTNIKSILFISSFICGGLDATYSPLASRKVPDKDDMSTRLSAKQKTPDDDYKDEGYTVIVRHNGGSVTYSGLNKEKVLQMGDKPSVNFFQK
ncbi:hypothetical protein Bealeia1_00058 [Candidatus Bealeia paramacronuclearis]|uniref:Uncharacterized protein n=1 Tax=Candidatus Bealeia paramacronuclearis TaxID=1921001 RepID=A0ABZ2C0A8_9PROT|nr:hypothetical protein [Candidatus Bealeia paramacronuclearis]